MSGLDERLRRFGRRRYDAPRAGLFVVLCGVFVLCGAALVVLQPRGAGLGLLGTGAVGLVVCELVGWRRRR